MPIEITMPRLSDTMEQGTVVKWNIKAGDTVSAGDVIADIETDKATMELESFDDGVVASLPVAEGKQVPVGTVIAVLAEEGESANDASASAGANANATQQAATAGGSTDAADERSESSGSVSTMHPPPADNGQRVFASPLARKVAAEHHIDLASVAGSGPSGRITRKDVEAVLTGPVLGGSALRADSVGGSALRADSVGGSALRADSPDRILHKKEVGSENRSTQGLVAGAVSTPPAPAPLPAGKSTLTNQRVELSNMRATIARRLIESKTTIPHYQVTVSARLDKLIDLRAQLNEQLMPQGVKLSVNDFLVRACAVAMHEHPFVNASWIEPSNGGQPAIQLHSRVHIGVAISLPPERGGGLVVATLRDADRAGLRQLSADTKRLAKKAREKGLTIEEMSDSTFTISNLGMFGVDHFSAIINPPNAAILAVGRAVETPFIEQTDDGPDIVIGKSMSMTLSSDHRIIDGAMAAAYLNTVKELLENPATLLV